MVLESGVLQERDDRYEVTGALSSLAIPARLQDSLMARLDRLAAVKTVAQLGATIGREFSYDLITKISSLDEGILQTSLEQLVDAELLYQHGLPPHSIYVFRHSLIRDTAYESLLKSRRQQYHQHIAQVLEASPRVAEIQPEILAYHYTQAELNQQAIAHWYEAGCRSAQRSANIETIGHLCQALGLIEKLPESPKRNQQELMIQIALGPPLIATKGYAAPEVREVYARAQELCQQEDAPQLFPILHGLWTYYLLLPDLRTAWKLAERCLRSAQMTEESSLLSGAYWALSGTSFFLGEFERSLEYADQGIAACNERQEQHANAFTYSQDPETACLSYAGCALWFLGYPNSALKKSQEALNLARSLNHPLSLSATLVFSAMTHLFRREWRKVRERAAEAIAICTEYEFAFFHAAASVLDGLALADVNFSLKGNSRTFDER